MDVLADLASGFDDDAVASVDGGVIPVGAASEDSFEQPPSRHAVVGLQDDVPGPQLELELRLLRVGELGCGRFGGLVE